MEDSGGVEVTKEASGGFKVTVQKDGEPVEVWVLQKKYFQAWCSWFNVGVCERKIYGALVKAKNIYGN